jgi:hypothetical protein
VLLSKAKWRPDTWKNVLGSSWNDTLTEPTNHMDTNWIACKYAAARSQEPCFPGSWVFVLDGVDVSTPHGWSKFADLYPRCRLHGL